MLKPRYIEYSSKEDNKFYKGLILMEKNGFFIGYSDSGINIDVVTSEHGIIGFLHEGKCINFIQTEKNGPIYNYYAIKDESGYIGNKNIKQTLSFEKNINDKSICRIFLEDKKNDMYWHEQDMFLGECLKKITRHIGQEKNEKYWEEYLYEKIIKKRKLISKNILERYNEEKGIVKVKKIFGKKKL